MCTVPLHSSSQDKIISQHYLSSVCGLEGEELLPCINCPWSKRVFRHKVFSQQKGHHTHLTSPRLHHDLGHVDDVSHHFYVLSLPALDGFRKDLQLKLFPLPQLLALWLGIAAELGQLKSRSQPKPSQFHQQHSHSPVGSGMVMSWIKKACFGPIT